MEKTLTVVEKLKAYCPEFVSVTYGAGGSTRQPTRDLVSRISQLGVETIPHLTCLGHSEEEIAELLSHYIKMGISNILALRGDKPKAPSHHEPTGDFTHAADLVRHLLQPENGSWGVGVAGFPEGHPESPNHLVEMDCLKAKVDAGAHYLCTQLFFDNHSFLDFRERCDLVGIRIPILAGIIPLTSEAGLRRMLDLAKGARIPAPLFEIIQKTKGNPDSFRQAGIEYTLRQCTELLANDVDGLHFYTLNQATATIEILSGLCWNKRPSPLQIHNRA